MKKMADWLRAAKEDAAAGRRDQARKNCEQVLRLCFGKMGGQQEQQAACQILIGLADAYNERMEFGKARQCFQPMHQYYDHPRFWEPQLLFMHYDPEAAPDFLEKAHRSWGERIERQYPRLKQGYSNRVRHERLRIGYVSPDCYCHPVASFLAPVLAAHDREKFQIYCYTNTPYRDGMTEKLKSLSEEWRDFAGQTDEALIRMIAEDEIDILVDLAGHTEYNRLTVFAAKPAPIQVTWLGYPNTTGLTSMDYRLTDYHADPVGMTDKCYTEELFRLPETFLCYSPLSTPEIGKLPAERNGYITFGSFNRLKKITPATLRLWAGVLQAVPNSRLFMKGRHLQEAAVRKSVEDIFTVSGVGRERLLFAEFMPAHQEHLMAFNEVDIVLDPLRYSGTTSTCEALWMGVPVVTLPGEIHVSRVSSSILTNAGLQGLVAGSEKQYIRTAAELAARPDILTQLRQTLRSRLQQSPMMDNRRFARHLEQAYHTMWGRYIAGF